MTNSNRKNKLLLGLVGASMTLSGVMAFADAPLTEVPMTITSAPIQTVQDNMPTGYIINGQKMIFDRLIMPHPGKNGEVLLPVKKISEGLGYKVSWSVTHRAVTLTFNGSEKTFSYLKDSEQSTGYQLKDQDGRVYTASIVLGSLYVTPQLFSESMNAVVISDQENQLRMDSVKHSPQEASTVGEVQKIEQGKDGIQILVKGRAFGQFGYDEISLAASVMKAKITTSDGTVLKLSDIKVGDQIYVKYGKSVAESLPPIGQAEEIILLKDEALIEGKVYFKQASVEKYPNVSSIAAPIYQLRVAGTSDYFLTLASNVVITDTKGNAKSFDDIKEGSVVRVYTSAIMTMSYPAQTAAYRIIIQ